MHFAFLCRRTMLSHDEVLFRLFVTAGSPPGPEHLRKLPPCGDPGVFPPPVVSAPHTSLQACAQPAPAFCLHLNTKQEHVCHPCA